MTDDRVICDAKLRAVGKTEAMVVELSNARFREITCRALDRMSMPSIGHVMVRMARLENENERLRARGPAADAADALAKLTAFVAMYQFNARACGDRIVIKLTSEDIARRANQILRGEE